LAQGSNFYSKCSTAILIGEIDSRNEISVIARDAIPAAKTCLAPPSTVVPPAVPDGRHKDQNQNTLLCDKNGISNVKILRIGIGFSHPLQYFVMTGTGIFQGLGS
jgi:hypothetical protein